VPARRILERFARAPVVLNLANLEPKKIDREGCLFTYIIEPMLWGSQPKYVVPIDVDGDGRISRRNRCPSGSAPAAAKDVRGKNRGIVNQATDGSRALRIASVDRGDDTDALRLFRRLEGNRAMRRDEREVSAVSRVSDMKGIMQA